MTSPFQRTAAALSLAMVFFAACQPPSEPEAPNGPPTADRTAAGLPESIAEALALFNHGAAMMDQYQYSRAAEAFEAVLELAPDWTAARFNLGLAYLNLQGARGAEEALDVARRTFEEVLADDPEHVHAIFSLGMYHQHLGNAQEALEYFASAFELNPDNIHAAYKYAETLLALDRAEEGTAVLEEIVAANPGYPSAVYRLAMQYQRAGAREKALPLFERFHELKQAELAGGVFTVGNVYGEAGRYSLVIGPDGLPLPRPETPATPQVVFSPEARPLGASTVAWNWAGEGGSGEDAAASILLPGLAAEDLNGNGHLDLVVTALDEEGRTAVWFNDGSGHFTPGPTIADRGVAPFLGDVNNNGHIDLWLGRAGPDRLFENDGAGNFHAVELPEADADLLTVSTRLVDLDSDGDLDLVACRVAAGSLPPGPASDPAVPLVLNNNLDGTFSDLTEQLGLAAPKVASVAVLDDFDNDRDIDLILFAADDALPTVWVNQRIWEYRLLPAEEAGLTATHVVSALSGDVNKSGHPDILVFTAEGVDLYLNEGEFRFRLDETFRSQFGHFRGSGGQLVDVDNNGSLDLVIFDAHRRDGTRGPVLLTNLWPEKGFVDAGAVDSGLVLNAIQTEGDASGLAADFTGNGLCDLLLAPIGQEPVLIENVTPGGEWIGLRLVGTRGQDHKTRSNRSAVGARVEVKAGTVYQQFTVGSAAGAVAAPPLRLQAGLGEHPQVDWLRIFWPDGVLQGEAELPTGQVVTVEQLNRKPSSCPHLFAWTGEHHEFVSDFGGVGGLGYLVSPGVYATPDPTEYIPLPPLEAKEGQYVLNVVNALEEVIYADAFQLIAVDHPADTRVHPHEMAAVSVPPPPFEVFCFDEAIYPARATNHLGDDVTEVLSRVDRRYAGATDPDPRFLGYAEEHYVELDFGDRLSHLDADDRLILFLSGWVEYSFSSTNFAASQAGLRLSAPTFEVFRDGEWVEIFREVGYPAGIQHTMTLDLTGHVLPTDRRLRVSSNMEIYWDSIFLAPHRADAELRLTERSAASAYLDYLGFPREYSPDGRQPNLFDFSNIDRSADWKLMAGDYTRFGEVAELLEEADNRFVIMGRGDGLTLRFGAEAFGPVPEGFRRSFLLKTVSFCKDMDLATAYPDTVEPLPFHGMSGYPYGPDEHYPDTDEFRRYRREYNTRRVGSR